MNVTQLMIPAPRQVRAFGKALILTAKTIAALTPAIRPIYAWRAMVNTTAQNSQRVIAASRAVPDHGRIPH